MTREDDPIGAIALYESAELGVSVYVSWTPGDIGMSGSAKRAVADLGLRTEDTAGLAATVAALKNGRDVTVTMRRGVDRRP